MTMRKPYDYDGEPEHGLPPLDQARENLTKAISEWGDGEVLEGFNTRDMCSLLEALGKVEAHVKRRGEFITAAQNSTANDGDYYRWVGHAGARRELATAMGWDVPGGWL